MRSLFVLALLLSACSRMPAPDSLSPGCANINDPFYDDEYQSGNVYFSPFRVGESVTVVASPDTATTITFIVTDTSAGVRRDFVTWRAESTEPLRYTFAQDYAQTEVYWAADAGAPKWEVTCEVGR